MSWNEGIWMAIILNGIGLPIFFIAYYLGFKKHEQEENVFADD